MAARHSTTRRIGAALFFALILAACGGADDLGTEGATAEPVGGAPGATIPETTGSASEPAVTAAPPELSAPVSASPVSSVAPVDPATDGILHVPGEHPTIQEAVTAAVEGELVLIAPGVYHEAVDVVTNNLTIRGLDRDSVVLDGELELGTGIRVLGADGVAVENLTVTNYVNNGRFWVSVEGYRASYINTYRIGDYGIYAFDSIKGQIERTHAVGSGGAGVYIGQCFPCDAVVDGVVASNSGHGYLGTNSGGNLLIVNSTWHNNRVGIAPNSGSYELCYPQRESTIVGNVVYSNNQPDTAAISPALLGQGNGILITGGVRNVIARNRVYDHDRTGIALAPFREQAPNDDLPTPEEWSITCGEQRSLDRVVPEGLLVWDSVENEVIGNIVSDSGEADLALASIDGDISTFGTCWSDNKFTTSAPLDVEALAPCGDQAPTGSDWTLGDLDFSRWYDEQASLPVAVDWRDAPLPDLGSHVGMADPATAPPRPAIDVPFEVDVHAITIPDA
jgi:hypothetical protein